jgi:hypothetical protein
MHTYIHTHTLIADAGLARQWFAQFWESEVPRIGEQGAGGFEAWFWKQQQQQQQQQPANAQVHVCMCSACVYL